jgi:hypothetical protein
MKFEFWTVFLESKISISILKIIDWVSNLFSTSVTHNESLLEIIINFIFISYKLH